MTRYVLDITRTLSRIGHGWPTGIDRVEHAYIAELSRRDSGALGLARMGPRVVAVPLASVADALPDLLAGRHLARPGLRDALRLKLPYAQRAARGYLDRIAVGAGVDAATALRGVTVDRYVNVGHTNLSTAHLTALRDLGASIDVMVHDLIPLTHPQFTRPEVCDRFERRMRTVAALADRVICNSAATRADVQALFAPWGRVPDTVVAHLGVTPLATRHAPADMPEFVILGTIEPRKNHAVLFAAWEELAKSGRPPVLQVIGKRGWMNSEVFEWLDTSPLSGDVVQELSDVDDAALAGHLSRARALLFPSFVEGYGLPALEAAAAGLPVICSDLPVFRELLGRAATYLPPDDPAAWAGAVRAVAQNTPNGQDGVTQATDTPPIPSWDSHFRHVFGQH